MRVIIVDDEELARAVLREYLGAHADIEIVAECANGFEAVKAIVECAPDLVLLDIQMPKLNGFEVVELAGGKPRYVFVTAYDQYALKAFEVHAIDYLLKPFSQQRLDQAIAHARAHAAPARAIAAMLVQGAPRQAQERILIRDGARVHVVATASVAWIEAQDDYVQIHSDGKSYLKNQTLSELEATLDAASFVRIHRSFIVNIASVSRIEQQGRERHAAVLADGTRLPISRSGYPKLKEKIG
ncbi:MAG: LytTR family DNA-binding domain-containing protein [Pseudomonadota bacterium]